MVGGGSSIASASIAFLYATPGGTISLNSGDAGEEQFEREAMTINDGANRRRNVRYTVYEPCFVVVDNQEYSGAVVDMSVGGAAIQFEIQLNVQPAPDTPIQLHIDGIGRLHTRVVYSRTSGVAVEFDIDPYKDAHLLAALKQVLSSYPIDE